MSLRLMIILLICAFYVNAQDYSQFQNKINKLYAAVKSQNENQINSTWEELSESKSIPIVQEDSVAFLYRGPGYKIVWMGDFNGWGYDQKFNNKGTRLGASNIWILKASFPKNARLDYKILVNDNDWVIDPENPNQQWSGVGGGSPNSELRMSEWKADPITLPRPDLRGGRLVKDLLFTSTSLGYQITYSVYLPSSYDPKRNYKVVYVMDGYEYLHERMGNMKVVLDNLIEDKSIEPIVAVFIDHREPVNRSNNRRMVELAMNSKYLSFFTDEFLPKIQKDYSVSESPAHRAILGTSMGGLTSAYFAFAKPGLFGMSGIQSPAFWFKPEIYTFCDNPENPPVKIFMSTGTINDSQEGTRRMKDILEKNTCNYKYLETNQGHSWGNWRDTIDDILIYFFATN